MKGIAKKEVKIVLIVICMLISLLYFMSGIVRANANVIPTYKIEYSEESTEAVITFDMESIHEKYEIVELRTRNGEVLYAEKTSEDVQFVVESEGTYIFEISYREASQEEKTLMTDEENEENKNEEDKEETIEPTINDIQKEEFDIEIKFEDKEESVENENQDIETGSRIDNANEINKPDKRNNNPVGWYQEGSEWKYNYTQITNGSLEVDNNLSHSVTGSLTSGWQWVFISTTNPNTGSGTGRGRNYYVSPDTFGWETTASDGLIELARSNNPYSGYNTSSAHDGSWFAELNANVPMRTLSKY